jgi:LytS/YehU family sensor histidine kinase
MKKYIKIEKLLPIILAILLPGLNFLNNSSLLEQYSILELIGTWITISIFLMILWYANELVIYRNISAYFLKAILLNTILASLFVMLVSLNLPDDIETSFTFYLTLVLRILIASAIFITIQQSIKSTRTVEKLKSENLSLKTEKYKAELDQLRKQVNPHFLFNSFSTLRTMIRNSDPNSESFLKNLSSLYRQILQKHDQDYISLEEELKFLDAYIYLMKVRHENALKIKIEINPQSHQYSIPIFALQLLIENCIKHNVVSSSKPLEIHIYQKDKVTITVSNNYQPKHESNQSSGLGLSNLFERYNLLGIDNGLVTDNTDSHYIVTIKLF